MDFFFLQLNYYKDTIFISVCVCVTFNNTVYVYLRGVAVFKNVCKPDFYFTTDVLSKTSRRIFFFFFMCNKNNSSIYAYIITTKIKRYL